jgi:hypothetical protein
MAYGLRSLLYRAGDAEFGLMEARMGKMIVAMTACALLTTLTVVDAQDNSGEKAKTQGDIARERAQACEGLKGQALEECMDNYVGPKRDITTGDTGNAAPEQQKGQETADQKGRDAGAGAEHDGSSKVDMQRANKRAPVGPIKSGPDNQEK